MRVGLFLLLLVIACSAEGPPPDSLDSRVESLLARMTVEEKVAQKAGSGGDPTDDLFYAGANERLGIPPFKMVDGPRGVRAGEATAFPVGIARGATWDRDLERRVGEAIGMEAAAKGANVILAPVVNVLRHPGWGRAQETYGEDPFHLGVMGVAFVEGAQEHVIASVKHFAANSIENTRFTVNVTVDERTLREVYLRAFERVVKVGKVGSVMSAYNKVNGRYCSENAHLLDEILRETWGFEGFVESDWVLGTHSTVDAANAGLDIEMPVAAYFGDDLLEAIRTGEVRSEVLDASVRRILTTKLRFQLDAPVEVPAEVIESEAHLDLAREVARRSMVLLKNDEVLPLDRGALRSIAVVGDLAAVANLGDHGSSDVHPSSVVTPLEGIEGAAGNVSVTYVSGATLTADGAAAVRAADVTVVVTGLTAEDEGEYIFGAGGDRLTLALPPERAALVRAVAAASDRTVLVLEGGSAIALDGVVDDVEAVLMAWYPGQEGGRALAELLFGDESPSGKLPVSFPVDDGQLPPFVADQDEVTYDYDHGYRHLDRQELEPLFPFGFGLSYTRFAYSNLSISADDIGPDGAVTVEVTIKNVGDRTGIEIAELYVGYEGSSVERPVRALKAFEAVSLAPGQERRVALELHARDLAYYDEAAGRFVVEPITYVVEVGGSSRDLPVKGRFAVRDR